MKSYYDILIFVIIIIINSTNFINCFSIPIFFFFFFFKKKDYLHSLRDLLMIKLLFSINTKNRYKQIDRII